MEKSNMLHSLFLEQSPQLQQQYWRWYTHTDGASWYQQGDTTDVRNRHEINTYTKGYWRDADGRKAVDSVEQNDEKQTWSSSSSILEENIKEVDSHCCVECGRRNRDQIGTTFFRNRDWCFFCSWSTLWCGNWGCGCGNTMVSAHGREPSLLSVERWLTEAASTNV